MQNDSMARFAANALFDAMQMLDSCKVKPLTELNTVALAQHPDGLIEESDLDGTQGRYIYKVELREKSGQLWEVDVDAASGEVIENYPH